MDMNNAEIKYFRFLSSKLNLNEDDAETFIALQKEVQASNLATKGDISDLRSELKGDIAELKGELKNIITESESRTGIKLERYRSNVLWAVVIFWLAQVGVFLGFAYKLFPGL
jgi:hypothetical protein